LAFEAETSGTALARHLKVFLVVKGDGYHSFLSALPLPHRSEIVITHIIPMLGTRFRPDEIFPRFKYVVAEETARGSSEKSPVRYK
jgi:hypothetical protein